MALSEDDAETDTNQNSHNRTGSMVIQHRTNSSLGDHLDLVNRMVAVWGSDNDDNNDDNIDSKDNNDKTKKLEHSEQQQKSATNEMKALKAEKEALEKAFDECIDPDCNGDVDVEEWLLGLQKLNVSLNETQQRKIYNFMDKDESGFVEKNDFVMFCTAKFDNQELLALQGPILQAVRAQNLHDGTYSNIMNPTLSADWTDFDVQILEQQMASAMTGMVETMKEELTEEKKFEEVMEQRLKENAELLNPENAIKWSEHDVVSWVNGLGMERYARYFKEEKIDGPMLLEDVTQDILESNLGVRTIDAKKIMREIYNLKKAVRGVTDLLLDESDFLCEHNIDDFEIKYEMIARTNEELEKTKTQKDDLKKYYKNEMMKLNKQIAEFKEEQKEQEKVGGFKNEIIFLDDKINEFVVTYTQDKLVNLHENNAESLDVKQELEQLELTNNSLSKTLQDISSYIKLLTVPNIMNYEEWDINMIILWIKTLDDGKYKKYCDVLREGFLNDGIENGQSLLAIDDQKDLRNEPFKINSLPDRKALIRHFQSLPTLKNQLINNINDNNNNKDKIDNEGAPTAYL